jgi:hypothetical protein
MEWRSWWQEAVFSGGAAAVARYLLHRRSSTDSTAPTRVQRFLQWLQFAKRLEMMREAEAMNQATNQRIDAYAKALVVDLDFCQTQNSALRARVRALEAELDGSGDSATGSTATPTRKTPPRKPSARRSVRRKRSNTPS